MAQNNPWDGFLSDQPSHLSVTYHSDEGSYGGRELIVKSAEIAYFRPISGGTRIMTRLPGNKFIGHNVKETPEQLLQMLGQTQCPDYATAVGNGMLPGNPLSPDRFIRTTMASQNEDLETGSAFYFRLDGPELIRESRADKGEAVVIFDVKADEPFLFGLQESPAHLFELAGRPRPKSVRDLAVAPDHPQL